MTWEKSSEFRVTISVCRHENLWNTSKLTQMKKRTRLSSSGRNQKDAGARICFGVNMLLCLTACVDLRVYLEWSCSSNRYRITQFGGIYSSYRYDGDTYSVLDGGQPTRATKTIHAWFFQSKLNWADDVYLRALVAIELKFNHAVSIRKSNHNYFL